jgi:hemolysin activation/secretion protein
MFSGEVSLLPLVRSGVVCLLLGAVSVVSAQQAPGPEADPAVEQRELERIDPDRFRPTPPLDIEIPVERPMERTPDSEIQVSSYTFRGNTVFDDATLAPLLDGYTGTLTFKKLLEGTRRVAEFYRQAGYLVAHTYVPEQEISDGVVEIAVLEGVLGEIRFEGDKPITRERASERMVRLAESGIINEADLEYGALLLKDLPGTDASVALRPGEKSGTSDVVLNLEDEGTFQFAADYNNFGAPVTGEHRLGFQAQANNLFDAGDRFTLRPIVSDSGDTLFGSIGYDMPLFTPATRVGLRFSHLESNLGEEFEDLEVENTATSIVLDATHAFIRGRNKNLNATFAYENRTIERVCGFCADTGLPVIEDADYSLDVVELGANGDWRSDRWGGAVNSWYAALRNGLSDVDQDDAGVTVPGGDRIEGKFTSFQFGGQRLQHLATNWSLSAKLDAQFSSNNLDSSERISLGGPYAVRAYRPSEALGDSGAVLQTELRRQFPGVSDRYSWMTRFEVYALLDGGVSELNDDGGNISRDLSKQRSGAGLGLRVAGSDQFYIDLVGARRLADRPSLVDQPDDSETNFWAQLVYWF